MKKVSGTALVFMAVLLLAPALASACRTCDEPSFWDSNCQDIGCTYCVACSTCCGGDPEAGGNCELYCGGGAFRSTQGSSLSRIFLKRDSQPDQAPGFFSQPASTQCSPRRP